MHIAEVVTIAKSLPLLRLNTYKSLILSYSADYRRIFRKNHIQGSAWGSVYAGGGLRGWCQDNEIIGDLVRDFGK